MKQTERIMRHLEAFGSITQSEALAEYGIARLASRISDLRRQGIPIQREMVTGRNRYGESISYARYSIAEGTDLCAGTAQEAY